MPRPRRCALSEVSVDELHGHRSFADGGGAALGRARADVSGREDARSIRLEQVLGVSGRAGEDEAVAVARDRIAEPLRARLRAEEEEQERERQALAVFERHRLELPTLSMQGTDLCLLWSRTATP